MSMTEEVNDEIQMLSEQLAAQRAECQSLLRALDRKDEVIQKQVDQFEQAEREVGTLGRRVVEAEQRNEALQSRISQADGHEKADEELQMLRDRIASHAAEHVQLMRAIAQKDDLILKQVDQLEAAERETDRLRRLIGDAERRTMVLQTRISRVDGATKALVEALAEEG